MTVGAGMDMNKLFAHATENSMSVQLMTLPFYAGLTLGGILSTASHGTGDRVPSALVDMVVEVTWVDAQGKVHKASRDTPETWKAINGGIGLIGVITELRLQLTPPTNTQLKTILNQPDDNMYEMIEKLLQVGGFGG
jgi:FAD/FMN-containing dehydrogenase